VSLLAPRANRDAPVKIGEDVTPSGAMIGSDERELADR